MSLRGSKISVQSCARTEVANWMLWCVCYIGSSFQHWTKDPAAALMDHSQKSLNLWRKHPITIQCFVLCHVWKDVKGYFCCVKTRVMRKKTNQMRRGRWISRNWTIITTCLSSSMGRGLGENFLQQTPCGRGEGGVVKAKLEQTGTWALQHLKIDSGKGDSYWKTNNLRVHVRFRECKSNGSKSEASWN